MASLMALVGGRGVALGDGETEASALAGDAVGGDGVAGGCDVAVCDGTADGEAAAEGCGRVVLPLPGTGVAVAEAGVGAPAVRGARADGVDDLGGRLAVAIGTFGVADEVADALGLGLSVALPGSVAFLVAVVVGSFVETALCVGETCEVCGIDDGSSLTSPLMLVSASLPCRLSSPAPPMSLHRPPLHLWTEEPRGRRARAGALAAKWRRASCRALGHLHIA